MMSEAEKVLALEALFRRCAEDHHRAFVAEDGTDAEWPAWYAAYLHWPVSALLERDITQGALEHWLVKVEELRLQNGAGPDWPAFYAADLLASQEILEASGTRDPNE